MSEVRHRHRLPCLSYGVPCPYLDSAGKPSAWTCCGERGVVRKICMVMECPQIEIARAQWRKMVAQNVRQAVKL